MLSIMGFATVERRVRFGLLALLAGQVLFLLGWGVLYVAALLYLMMVGLPYPRVLRSSVSRLAAGFVLLLSLVQVAGVAQFWLFPASNFGVLSLLVSAMVAGLVWALRKLRREPEVLWDHRDTAGIGVALFFALPLALLCFWQNDPARLTAFASVQGVDGANHYTMIAEMARAQHLNYRDTAYYPKGFHLASAFLLHGLHANQQDQSWLMNAKLYVAMFIGWGSILAYVTFYAAVQLRQALAARLRLSLPAIVLSLGPALTLLYLIVFTQEGFLSYFYVISAVVYGVLYLQDARIGHKEQQWPFVAYFLLVFGVTASWGPLLASALLLVPVLYAWPYLKKPRHLWSSQWRWAVLMFVLQVVPFCLHVRYAHLSAQQGIDATGGLKLFDYGVFLADLAIVAYALVSRDVPETWRRFAGNVLMPFVGLVGVLMCYQYFTVGELRYYTIKTALLVGVLVLALAVVVLGSLFARSKLSRPQVLLLVPILLGLGLVVLSGATSSPFDRPRILFGTLAHMNQRPTTIRVYTNLGVAGRLKANTVELRYDADGVLVGNPVVNNWANLMQFTPNNSVEMGRCSSRFFDLEIAPPTPSRSAQLVAVARDCARAAARQQEPFIVVTDASSAARLRSELGDVTYAY